MIPRRERSALSVILMFVLTSAAAASWYDTTLLWKPQPEKAAILFAAAHPDDECGSFAGIMTFHAAALKLPVVHIAMTSGNAYGSCPVSLPRAECREKELLCADWTAGMPNPPVFARFLDCCGIGDTVNGWIRWGGRDSVVRYLTGQIRKYRPEAILTHAFDGEYGHPNHITSCLALVEAFDAAADPERYPQQLSSYPVWQARKLYVHNWNQNAQSMDLTVRPPQLGGQSIQEVNTRALRCHISQGMANRTGRASTTFGLYKTFVGQDGAKTNNFFDHIDTSIFRGSVQTRDFRGEAAMPFASIVKRASEIEIVTREKNCAIRLFDAGGRDISGKFATAKRHSGHVIIDISNARPGIYIIYAGGFSAPLLLGK